MGGAPAELAAMVIERGRPWGAQVICPTDLRVATDDAELARLIGSTNAPDLAIAGGDLHRTLGGPGLPTAGEPCRRLPVDLLRCEIDGVVHLAVAHVVLRRPGRLGWWRGPILGVCNAQFHGRWDVAPRGHPNDGRADLVEVAAGMTVGQRRLARRRLPTGTHVPHPDITTRRIVDLERELGSGLVAYLDHRRIGSVRQFRVEVVADGFTLHV